MTNDTDQGGVPVTRTSAIWLRGLWVFVCVSSAVTASANAADGMAVRWWLAATIFTCGAIREVIFLLPYLRSEESNPVATYTFEVDSDRWARFAEEFEAVARKHGVKARGRGA